MYEVRQNDIYDIIKNNLDEFDTSDYSNPNRFDMPLVNKKIPGKMKDECNGNIMTHFIGLRSKMYCMKIEDQELIKKAKGVKSNVVKNKIEFEDYHKCLFNEEIDVREHRVIKAPLHNIHTQKKRIRSL